MEGERHEGYVMWKTKGAGGIIGWLGRQSKDHGSEITITNLKGIPEGVGEQLTRGANLHVVVLATYLQRKCVCM